jgi:predicted HTH transcriptional regulator
MERSFAELRRHAAGVMEYLGYSALAPTDEVNVPALIRKGESFDLEFKSTLRLNLATKQKDAAIEHASLKTISAFLNSGGGTLLIGVRDDGSIEGIETDGFPNVDKFSLHFWNLIKSALGQELAGDIHTSFETIDGKIVCVVRCSRSGRPVFTRKGADDEFYVRAGPGTARLTVREALQYIQNRFPG